MSKFWQKKYISTHTGAEIDEAVEAVLDGDVGTTVVANPTLAGTEPALTGLQVGDDKFAVGGMTEAEADLRYLQLSGGTMTGAIKLQNSSNQGIIDNLNTNVISGGQREVHIGDSSNTNEVYLKAKSNGYITAVRGSSSYIVLDSGNTAANPTLAGTEAALTSLKLNGTSYSVGPSLYWHSVQLYYNDATNGFDCYVLILSNNGTAITKATLKDLFGSNHNAKYIIVSGTGTGSANMSAHLSFARYYTDDAFNLYMNLNGSAATTDITVSWNSNNLYVNDDSITRIL